MSFYKRYRYFYNPNPAKCPICGECSIADVVYKDSCIGLQNIKGRLLWCCSEDEISLQNNKICLHCGQPIYSQKYELIGKDDSDYFYVYMDAFLGWRGCADTICLALNISTGELTCTVFENFKHKDIKLDQKFTDWLKENYYSLLHYTSTVKEDTWCDTNVYEFYMMALDESNKFSFQSPYMEKHPLFRNLVELILKTFQTKEIRQ